MAEVIRQNDATGETIATEEISSKKYQKVIVVKTTTGAAIAPLTDTELRATAVPVSGPVTDAELRASDVKITLDSEAVVLGAGSAEIGKLAAGTAEIGNVKNSGTFAVQATLQAGSAAIGKLAANSGVDIGDVDVASVPTDPFGANADAASATGSISAKLRHLAASGIAGMTSLPAGTNAIGKLASNDGVDIGNVDVASVAAGENMIGQTVSPDSVVLITASLDTSIYADGDTLFDTQEIASAARVNGGTVILQSVMVSDISDQGQPFDLIFFNANTSLGTENSAPDINDTEVLTVIGRVSISSADYYDLGANRVACVRGIGLMMKAGAATTSLYVAGVSRGTGTYTASGLQIQFGFMRN